MPLHKIEYSFFGKKSTCFFDASFSYLQQLVTKENAIIVTDENVYTLHKNKMNGWETIVIKAGEENKQQATANFIIAELIKKRANKKTLLIGIGGGVVTDITGYVASIYMRGVNFGFVPTTILGMVDAAVGGKNGIDVGLYKNIIGTICQPSFLLYDYSLLETLPHQQWANGFAEIIKHACIKDPQLFSFLENNVIDNFRKDKNLLDNLIQKNVQLKTNIVLKDEFEKGERKLLNFGHTFGHAIENEYNLLHGHAISIGMLMAATISEEINNFYSVEKERLAKLLQQYQLPISIKYNPEKVFEMMQLDKKAENEIINYILLNKIGEAIIYPIPIAQLKDIMHMYQ
jgi:3-dehydroquinate synthase